MTGWRRLFRIARWELERSGSRIDRKTAIAAIAILLLAGGIVGIAVVGGIDDVGVDRDIYRVGVAPDNPYYDAVEAEPTLAAVDPEPAGLDSGSIDVLLDGGGGGIVAVQVADTRRGDAAHAAVVAAVERYNEAEMATETNQSAAYPVLVDVQYLPRLADQPAIDGAGGPADVADPAAPDSDDADGEDRIDGDPGDDTVDDPATDGDFEDGTIAGDDGEIDPGTSPAVGSAILGGTESGSPAAIQPPFPFGSLLLAFAFLVPMNFVIQAYGSSILNERINRRGELLLASPASRREIVAGKTLPYLALGVGLTALIALAIGGGIVSVLAVLPIVLAFLSTTFFGAMLARSFKELTFVTVTISVFLTSYVFVPAIFTNVTPIALISPLTLVVMDLQGTAIGFGEYVFATAPFYVGSLVCFLLGAGIYREEDMFTQRSIPGKLLDALDAQLSGYRSVALLSALFIPFVFVAELLAVAVLFVAPVALSIPVLLVTIAAIEELAKSVHVYAGFQSSRFEASIGVAIALGTASGIGFFVGEKATAIGQLVGLPELAVGQAVLAPAGVTPVLTIGLFLAPLVLHVVTATITALGARDSRRVYASALLIATVVHALYNYGVIAYAV